MALAIDASTPARWTGASPITSASFTAPAGALLLLTVSSEGPTNGNNTVTGYTISGTNQYSGLTWANPVAKLGSGFGAAFYTATAAGGSAGTITVSITGDTGAASLSVKLYVLTDTSTPTIGAVVTGSSASANFSTTAYTSTVNNSWGFAVGIDKNDGPAGVPTSSDVGDGARFNGNYSYSGYLSAHTSATTPQSGTAVQINMQSGPTTPSPTWFYAVVEVRTVVSTSQQPAGFFVAENRRRVLLARGL